MDPELKQYPGGMETRIIERVVAVEQHVVAVEERVGAIEERLKDFVREAVRDLETKLVAEFWKWGRIADLRTRQVISDVSLFGERLMAVEDRMTALERGR
jgi:ABC-type phosphonate transport system ATPase subunit